MQTPEPIARRREFLRAAHVRRRVGRILIGTGTMGIVVAILGTAVVWRLVGDINAATRNTLDITLESLGSLQDTLDLADGVLGSTGDSLQAVEDNLRTVGPTLSDGSASVSAVSELSATSEPALRDAVSTLRQLEGVGSQIDGVLVGVSALPIGPDYNPETGLGPTFGRLATNLEPLPQAFADTSASLDDLSSSLTAMETELQTLTDAVADVNDELQGSEQLLADYRSQAEAARTVAVTTRDDLDRDQTLLRILAVVGGLVFAAMQLTPLWAGWELLDGAAEAPDPGDPGDPGSEATREGFGGSTGG